jgi:hypothetical protein
MIAFINFLPKKVYMAIGVGDKQPEIRRIEAASAASKMKSPEHMSDEDCKVAKVVAPPIVGAGIGAAIGMPIPFPGTTALFAAAGFGIGVLVVKVIDSCEKDSAKRK